MGSYWYCRGCGEDEGRYTRWGDGLRVGSTTGRLIRNADRFGWVGRMAEDSPPVHSRVAKLVMHPPVKRDMRGFESRPCCQSRIPASPVIERLGSRTPWNIVFGKGKARVSQEKRRRV